MLKGNHDTLVYMAMGEATTEDLTPYLWGDRITQSHK